jgi:hypothetical protein
MNRRWMAAVAAALVLLAGCGDTSDPELTQQFIEEFTACLTDEGINVDRVDASVTEDRELQMRGWASSGEEPPSAEYADVDCENALMQELRLRPYLG